MANAKKTAAPKRKVLTPQERIAKAEAELAELRSKAKVKGAKRSKVLNDQRSKLVDQIKERQTKVDAIDAELDELGDVVFTEDAGIPDAEATPSTEG
jgi:N-dimethylarginine dimethylaminohydrolase